MTLLQVEPSSEVLFWLSDESPKCNVSLRFGDPDGQSAVAFRIQPSERHRYAIWPSVGVVSNGGEVSVAIVLLEHARNKLKNSFKRLGPLAEFRQMDKIHIEWCKLPDTIHKEICGEEDQDFEILTTFWNSNGYALSAPVISSREALRVRFSDEEVLSTAEPTSSTISMDGSSSNDGCISPSGPQEVSIESEEFGHYEVEVQAMTHFEEERPTTKSNPINSSSQNIKRSSLEESLQCGCCHQLFSRDPLDPRIPILSRACGHSVCRSCVTIRMKNVGIYPSAGMPQGVECPLCNAPSAFGQVFDINHSLCAVIGLLDR